MKRSGKFLRAICTVQIADDVQFEVVGISDIRETDDYPGIRVGLKANYPPISVPLTVDVTTGDMITPREVEYTFSMLFDDRQISILAYNLETVLAGKAGNGVIPQSLQIPVREIITTYISCMRCAVKSVIKKHYAGSGTDNKKARQRSDSYGLHGNLERNPRKRYPS